jgi:hypothetical protein
MLWFDAVGAAQGSRVWVRDEAAVRALRQHADGRPPSLNPRNARRTQSRILMNAYKMGMW